MCDRCKKIDKDAEYLRHLQPTLDDRLTLIVLAETIEDLQSEKAALHADNGKKSDE